MATASDPYFQTAKRDSSLLRRGYRFAKRAGDMKRAMEFARMGDELGIPVGRPTAMEELQGVGQQRYGAEMQRGQIAGSGARYRPGMGAADVLAEAGIDTRPDVDPGFSTGGSNPPAATMPSSSGAPSPSPAAATASGGYNLGRPLTRIGGNQYRGNQLADAAGNTNSGSIGGYDFAQRNPSPIRPVSEGGQGHAAYPSIHNVDRRASFSMAWQKAKTQEAKDELVERAEKLGVPMNRDLAMAALQRRGSALLPAPNPIGSGQVGEGPGPQDQPELPGTVTMTRAAYDLRRRRQPRNPV